MLTFKDSGERKAEVFKNGQKIGDIAPLPDDSGYAGFKQTDKFTKLEDAEYGQLASAVQSMTTH
jgi:hypothetical protein